MNGYGTIDLMGLRLELEMDPLNLGYAGTTAEQAANILNQVDTGRTRARASATPAELLNATSAADLSTLADRKLELFKLIVSAAPIPMTSSSIRAMLAMIFEGTETLARLVALELEPVSRAVELFGEPVGYWHVDQARGLP